MEFESPAIVGLYIIGFMAAIGTWCMCAAFIWAERREHRRWRQKQWFPDD